MYDACYTNLWWPFSTSIHSNILSHKMSNCGEATWNIRVPGVVAMDTATPLADPTRGFFVIRTLASDWQHVSALVFKISVRNYVNGVRVLQVLVDQPVDAFQSPDLKLTFRGLARLKQHQPRRAQAITPEMLSRMSEFVDRSNTLDLVVWTAILLAFFCLLRKSNYVPDSQKAFDRSKQLCREDVAVGPDCLVVHIKWSKTIQLAERTLHIPVLAIPNSPICPVKAFQQMVSEVPAGPDDPAFCIPSKKGNKPLTYRVFQSRLKQLVHKAGWVAAAFSSHSLRRGGGGGGGVRVWHTGLRYLGS